MRTYERLISVIVPVYNVKEYVVKCISSILNQTYANIEIIIVDDGSTDGSGILCDNISLTDKRVRIFHKNNGGLASARNFGLEKARGEFVGFVDSDDYIKNDMYQELILSMYNDVDITCCGTVEFFPDRLKKHPISYCNSSRPIKMSNKEAIRKLLLLKNICFSSCDKLFRKELFREITFPEGRVCEDIPTIYQLIKKSRNVVNIGKSKYFYRFRDNSISRKDFFLQRTDYVMFARDIFFDIKKNHPDLEVEAEAMYIKHLYVIVKDIAECTNKNKYIALDARLRKALKKNYIRIICNPFINKEQMKEINIVLIKR